MGLAGRLREVLKLFYSFVLVDRLVLVEPKSTVLNHHGNEIVEILLEHVYFLLDLADFAVEILAQLGAHFSFRFPVLRFLKHRKAKLLDFWTCRLIVTFVLTVSVATASGYLQSQSCDNDFYSSALPRHIPDRKLFFSAQLEEAGLNRDHNRHDPRTHNYCDDRNEPANRGRRYHISVTHSCHRYDGVPGCCLECGKLHVGLLGVYRPVRSLVYLQQQGKKSDRCCDENQHRL